jgi:hypothetical protein
MIFRNFTHFLGIYLFIFGILEKKMFLARGLASGPWSTASLGQQPVKAAMAGLAAHRPTAQVARQPDAWVCRRTVTAAMAGAGAWAAQAHRWVRCGLVCGMSTTGVETTHRATRGSGRLTVMVARHEDGGGGPAWR